MAEFKLGINATAWHGNANTDPSSVSIDSMVLMDNIKDVTLNLEAGEADTSTRKNSGWASTTATLKKGTATFQMQAKDNDAALAQIKEAYMHGYTVPLGFLDGPIDTAGSEGPVATWSITNFQRSEPLEETVKYDVTAKISTYIEWHES